MWGGETLCQPYHWSISPYEWITLEGLLKLRLRWELTQKTGCILKARSTLLGFYYCFWQPLPWIRMAFPFQLSISWIFIPSSPQNIIFKALKYGRKREVVKWMIKSQNFWEGWEVIWKFLQNYSSIPLKYWSVWSFLCQLQFCFNRSTNLCVAALMTHRFSLPESIQFSLPPPPSFFSSLPSFPP